MRLLPNFGGTVSQTWYVPGSNDGVNVAGLFPCVTVCVSRMVPSLAFAGAAPCRSVNTKLSVALSGPPLTVLATLILTFWKLPKVFVVVVFVVMVADQQGVVSEVGPGWELNQVDFSVSHT